MHLHATVFRTLINKLLLYMSYAASGILLEQLEQTNTRWLHISLPPKYECLCHLFLYPQWIVPDPGQTKC